MTLRAAVATPSDPRDTHDTRATLGDNAPLRDDRALVILVRSDHAQPLAGAVIELDGAPPSPGVPRLARLEPASIPDDALHALLDAAEHALRERRHNALCVPASVCDAHRLRLLESRGHRPEGGPYLVIGPGVVEPLHGYTGPEDALADMHQPL